MTAAALRHERPSPGASRWLRILGILTLTVAPVFGAEPDHGTTFAETTRGIPYDAIEGECEPGESRWVDRHGCPVSPPSGKPESTSCGGFVVDFADVMNATGTGFDDPLLGLIRQNTVCQVLIDLSNVIDLSLPSSMGSNPDILVEEAENDGQGPLASASPVFLGGTAGCTAGALHEHITTGLDPTPGAGDYDALIRQVDFGDRVIGANVVSVNSDWMVIPTTDLDLYSITLHEVTHALGFFSLIGPTGGSVQNGNFALFDEFLTDGNAAKLVDPFCSAFQGTPADLTSNLVRYNTPASHVSVPQPVYSPAGFSAGSSLSHFDDVRGGMRYVMRPSTIGGADRVYTEPELDVLCDLGYTVFGNVCNNHWPVGIDDDDLTANTTEPGVEICIEVLANDFDPDGDPISIDPASVQIVSGGGSFTINGSEICYTPAAGFTGTALVTYQPTDGDRLGNITRVLIDVQSDVCPDDPCNLVCNGGFEAGVPDDDDLDFSSMIACPSKVDGWCRTTGSPDLFIRGSVNANFGIPSNFFSGNAPNGQVDTWNGVGNDRYVGVIQDGINDYTEGLYTQTSSPLTPGTPYILDLVAYDLRRGSIFPSSAGFLQIYLDTVVPNGGPPSANAQLLGTVTVPDNQQWNAFQIPFTAAGSQLQYLVIQAQAPPPAGTSAFIYLDDVAIREDTDLAFDLLKWVDDPTPQIGQTITYTIAACNLETTTATNVVIEDLLPGGLTYVSGFSAYPQHTFPSIAGQACETVDVVAIVDASVPLNVPVTNCASLASEGSMCASFEDDRHCVDIVVAGTDIGVEKLASPTNPQVGTLVDFTIVVSNLGTGDAADILVNDLLPPGLVFVAFNAPTASYDPPTGDIKIPFLAAGASEVVTITVIVDDDACDAAITNTATLVEVAGTDTNPTNNQGSAAILVGPCDPGDCQGLFVDSGQLLGSSDSLGVSLGDLDGDGDLDAAVANFRQPATLWRNNGSGFFSLYQTLPTDEDYAVALGDLDGDGDLDLFVGDNSGPGTVWRNNGTGTMLATGQALGNANSLDAALGDVDGDGDLDIVEANNGANQVWRNDGTGTFTTGQGFGGSVSWGIALGDVNGNGTLDAFAANVGLDRVWQSFGGLFFDSGQALSTLTGRKVALADLDGDGDLDAVVRTVPGQADEVWRNSGGAFSNTGQTLGTAGSAVALGDLDCNGSVDAYFGNSGSNRVWLNDGTGTFVSGQAMGSSRTGGVALGDLDGDGDLDAFVANLDGPNRVWFNN